MENVDSRTRVFIYACKFKDVDYLKVGWSTDPIRRCCKLGEIERIAYSGFLGNRSNAMFLEAMFHRALAEFKVGDVVHGKSNDGRTEYFETKAIYKFMDLCKLLNMTVNV